MAKKANYEFDETLANSFACEAVRVAGRLLEKFYKDDSVNIELTILRRHVASMYIDTVSGNQVGPDTTDLVAEDAMKIKSMYRGTNEITDTLDRIMSYLLSARFLRSMPLRQNVK